MFKLTLGLKRILMLIGDYAVFQIALLLTLQLRYGGISWEMWQLHVLPFSFLGLLWVISFYINGLYDLALTQDNIKFFRTYLESMIINLSLALAVFYLIPIFGIAPRTNLILDFVLALLLGYAWRLFFNRAIAQSVFKNKVLFVGRSADAYQVQKLLKNNALGFEYAGMIETEQGAQLGTLMHTIQTKEIQTIILGHRPDDIPGLKEELYKTLFTHVVLLDRAALEETLTGRVPLEHVSETWFLEHLRESDKAWYEIVKRGIDIILALPFGILTLCIYPLVACAIKISSPGPVLYSQIRTGKYGKPFRIYKFRSMHTDSEKNGPQFTANAKTDPRLFGFGRLLRQLRIDEFPQIWNVLRGDLSFIGPRPERPEFIEPLTERVPFYTLRHLTRPGLTGWAQTRFLTPTSSLDDNLIKLRYDLYYIKHRSLMLDLAIMLKTIGIVLRRQGT